MQAIPRLKNLQLANLSKAPTLQKSVDVRPPDTDYEHCCLTRSPSKFRHTTPGSSTVLIANRQQHPSSYPGAHLPFHRRHALVVRCAGSASTSTSMRVSKPATPYSLPYVPRPYRTQRALWRPERRSAENVDAGAAVEESGGPAPRIVFRPEDVGAEKWIVPDWTYIALPTTEMFRMSFTEQLGLMRKTLGFIHRRIPDAEKHKPRTSLDEVVLQDV
ncbi:hypothetical protein EDB87DRAFT_1833443 [Lactarius vividus]|nr:hypothetical protein EDB87DRAFT_1833443 [Lactarius vividus]